MKLTQVRKFALSLPQTIEKPHFHRTSFRVRGKIFVTADPKEPYIHIFVADEHREPILAMYPQWAEKLMWGKKVAGLRIKLKDADSDVVTDLISQAWQSKAPQSLSAKLRDR